MAKALVLDIPWEEAGASGSRDDQAAWDGSRHWDADDRNSWLGYSRIQLSVGWQVSVMDCDRILGDRIIYLGPGGYTGVWCFGFRV